MWNRGAFDELVNDSYTTTNWYSGRAHWNQDAEQCHRTFSNLVLRGKLCEAVIFVCEQETGVFLSLKELTTSKTDVTEETANMVLAGKHLPKPPRCSTLEVYDKTPIFISVDIFLGGLGPGGMDLEALQVWLLKFGDESKILCTSVEILVVWISNQSTPWAWMFVRLVLRKLGEVFLISV